MGFAAKYPWDRTHPGRDRNAGSTRSGIHHNRTWPVADELSREAAICSLDTGQKKPSSQHELDPQKSPSASAYFRS